MACSSAFFLYHYLPVFVTSLCKLISKDTICMQIVCALKFCPPQNNMEFCITCKQFFTGFHTKFNLQDTEALLNFLNERPLTERVLQAKAPHQKKANNMCFSKLILN